MLVTTNAALCLLGNRSKEDPKWLSMTKSNTQKLTT
jgi:hypothetical protein